MTLFSRSNHLIFSRILGLVPTIYIFNVMLAVVSPPFSTHASTMIIVSVKWPSWWEELLFISSDGFNYNHVFSSPKSGHFHFCSVVLLACSVPEKVTVDPRLKQGNGNCYVVET